MNNSCYDKALRKTEESVKLGCNGDQLLKLTVCAQFCQLKIFDKNSDAISSRTGSFLWNKPTLVGASIFEPAKHHMLQFPYNGVEKHLNCLVLYSGTDYPLYDIKHISFNEDLAEHSELRRYFDVSTYPGDRRQRIL